MNLPRMEGEPLSAFLAAFVATLCGMPLLLTLASASALGPVTWACAVLGALAATGPLFLLGRVLSRLGVRLPARWCHLADDPRSAAVLAAALPSFTLYWVLLPLLGKTYPQALGGTLVSTAPLVLLLGVAALSGRALGVPGVLVTLISLAFYFAFQYLSHKKPHTHRNPPT